MSAENKKILVTGASGFIGRVLCLRLVDHAAVVAATRNKVNFPESLTRLQQIEVGDIGPATNWSSALVNVDVVIHLAARVHVMRDMAADPLDEFRSVNTFGTEHLARCAAASGVKRLVYVSSIGVNGSRTGADERFSETDVPHPHNAYAISKWEAEQALANVARETGLQIVIVRPPLVYGGGAPGNFATLVKAVSRGIPLPLASVRNLRSLIYVGNLVDALITCATHPAASGQTYLVCDGEDISTAALIQKLADALGRNSRSFHFPAALLRAGAAVMGRSAQADSLIGSLRVNDAKIRGELGWIPPYTLEQGLRATADWYHQHLD